MFESSKGPEGQGEDFSAVVGPLVLWTETTKACACGTCEGFGEKTLAAVRRAREPFTVGGDHVGLYDREDAQALEAEVLAHETVTFRAGFERLSSDQARELARLLRERVAPRLRPARGGP